MSGFISQLAQTATKNIAELDINEFNQENPLLEGHEFVKRLSPHDI